MVNKTDIENLINRLGDSASDDPELLKQAFDVIVGLEPPSQYDPRAEPMFCTRWSEWVNRRQRFLNALQFDNYEIAARILLPSFRHLLVCKELWNDATLTDKSHLVSINRYGETMWTGQFEGLANTLAHAIACAALKAELILRAET